jgi:hypothetical protein
MTPPNSRGGNPCGQKATVTVGDMIYEGVLAEMSRGHGDSDLYGYDRLEFAIALDRTQPRPGATVREDTSRPSLPQLHRDGVTFVSKRIAESYGYDVDEEDDEDNEGENMYNVTILRDLKSKSGLIYVQVLSPEDPTLGAEVYLVKDGNSTKEVGRPVGADMPLYDKVPDELFVPLARAISDSDYS